MLDVDFAGVDALANEVMTDVDVLRAVVAVPSGLLGVVVPVAVELSPSSERGPSTCSMTAGRCL